ncbi:MAG: class I SAM-dependent RNA methyltransferase [Bdellovibrionales bacterium]|nr:class I SAM-dependent RNA methyltransferase [Bdellovibrionales bacterium]
MSSELRVKVGDQVSLRIERLSFGDGDGVARLDKLVVFVPFSAPGDTVQAEITFKKKNFARAKIIEITKPSSSRRSAPCQVFGECGGCQWQHIDYSHQVSAKHELLVDAVTRAGLSVAKFHDIVASKSEYHYRNRIQMQFSGDQFGFRARKSHKFVATDECLIAETELNELAIKSRGKLEGRHELYRAPNNKIMMRNSSADEEGHFFSQINSEMNLELQKLVVGDAPRGQCTVWDLYGGSGNFSLKIASQNPDCQIYCVDANAKNIENGRIQAAEQNIANIEFVPSTTFEFLEQNRETDHCVVDPPRSGLDAKTLDMLSKDVNLKSLIYISCDPMTLIRDLKHFQSAGWAISSMQAIDMFPQTHHLEVYTRLSPPSDA